MPAIVYGVPWKNNKNKVNGKLFCNWEDTLQLSLYYLSVDQAFAKG